MPAETIQSFNADRVYEGEAVLACTRFWNYLNRDESMVIPIVIELWGKWCVFLYDTPWNIVQAKNALTLLAPPGVARAQVNACVLCGEAEEAEEAPTVELMKKLFYLPCGHGVTHFQCVSRYYAYARDQIITGEHVDDVYDKNVVAPCPCGALLLMNRVWWTKHLCPIEATDSTQSPPDDFRSYLNIGTPYIGVLLGGGKKRSSSEMEAPAGRPPPVNAESILWPRARRLELYKSDPSFNPTSSVLCNDRRAKADILGVVGDSVLQKVATKAHEAGWIALFTKGTNVSRRCVFNCVATWMLAYSAYVESEGGLARFPELWKIYSPRKGELCTLEGTALVGELLAAFVDSQFQKGKDALREKTPLGKDVNSFRWSRAELIEAFPGLGWLLAGHISDNPLSLDAAEAVKRFIVADFLKTQGDLMMGSLGLIAAMLNVSWMMVTTCGEVPPLCANPASSPPGGLSFAHEDDAAPSCLDNRPTLVFLFWQVSGSTHAGSYDGHVDLLLPVTLDCFKGTPAPFTPKLVCVSEVSGITKQPHSSGVAERLGDNPSLSEVTTTTKQARARGIAERLGDSPSFSEATAITKQTQARGVAERLGDNPSKPVTDPRTPSSDPPRNAGTKRLHSPTIFDRLGAPSPSPASKTQSILAEQGELNANATRAAGMNQSPSPRPVARPFPFSMMGSSPTAPVRITRSPAPCGSWCGDGWLTWLDHSKLSTGPHHKFAHCHSSC